MNINQIEHGDKKDILSKLNILKILKILFFFTVFDKNIDRFSTEKNCHFFKMELLLTFLSVYTFWIKIIKANSSNIFKTSVISVTSLWY